MKVLLGSLVCLPALTLVVGSLRGRVQVRSCCVDAEHDRRMSPAYADDPVS